MMTRRDGAHVAYQLWLYATHSTNTRLEIDRFSCCPQENFPVYYKFYKIDSCESQEAMILFFTRNLSMPLSKVNNLFSSGQITNTMYSICCPLIRKGEVMEKDKIRLLGLKCVFNWLAVNENGSRVFLHKQRRVLVSTFFSSQQHSLVCGRGDQSICWTVRYQVPSLPLSLPCSHKYLQSMLVHIQGNGEDEERV